MKHLDIIPYFQPIISMSQKEIFGFEVLARGIDAKGEVMLPRDLFAGKTASQKIGIDRIVREKAFERLSQSGKQEAALFINVPPAHFLEIKDIRKDSHIVATCDRFGIDYGRVTIEITEKSTDHFPRIAKILKQYRNVGFRVAIDDWGAEQSNFDRLSMITPDIVKFDAAFLWRAVADPSIAEMFCTAVNMVLKLGVNVIAEGVEEIEHLYLALEAGCPLIQGFLLGRPAPGMPARTSAAAIIQEAFSRYREGRVHHLIREKNRIKTYSDILHKELNGHFNNGVRSEVVFGHVREMFTRHEAMLKAYVLDSQGVQTSPNLVRDKNGIRQDPAMIDRDWSWRPYYIETLVNQRLFDSRYTVTGPYIDSEVGKSVFTLCAVLGRHMVCIDFSNDD